MPVVQLRGGAPVLVGAVYCLGRNYAEHAREMGAPATPVAFLKPASAVTPAGGEIPWPAEAEVIHHEVELVLLLGAGRTNLSREQADRAIAAVGVGVDLTARDLQDAAKRSGQPWSRSKGFPGSAPVSEFVPRAEITSPWSEIDLSLAVDDELRQQDRASSMLLDPPTVVALLSQWFELAPSDLVFTGTPSGVGPIRPGQRVVAASHALALAVEFRLRR